MVIRDITRVVVVALILVLNALVVTYLYSNQKQETTILNDELRKEAPGQFVNLKYGPVHYSYSGKKTLPLLIFIHGGGVTGMEVWKENIPFFKSHQYRVLAYDLYGRGYSARPNVTHSTKLYKDQLIELLDTLNIEASFDVIALSMGAIPGLDLYQIFPDRVKHLILIDPIASGSFKPNNLLKIPVLSDFLITTYWYPMAIENQRKEFVNQSLFNRYSRRLFFFQDIEGYKKTNYSTWMNVLQENRIQILEEIPTENMLIIYGDEDPYFGEGQRQLYNQLHPAIRMIEIDSTGHMPQYEKPKIVNKLILDFIRSDSIANTPL